MAAYSKTTITSGDTATAAWANAIQTQYDCVVTEATAGNIPVGAAALTGTIAAARLPARNGTIFLSAAGGKPRTTSGCAPPAWTETSTNKIMVPTLDFDSAADENAQWLLVMPEGYTGGTLTVKFFWTAASGSAGDTVVFMIAAGCLGNDDALDTALGTAAGAQDALITANDVHITAAFNLTAANAAGGEVCVFNVYRDVSEDNLAVDARLIGVRIEYPTSYGD